MEIIEEVTKYIEDLMDKSDRRSDPETYQLYFDLWIRCWLVGWAKEFFCDLFAVYVLGPAYVWSHLHLTATRGTDPYYVPLFGRETAHPPDAARMSTMLIGLMIGGFDSEAEIIEKKWKGLLEIAQAKPTSEYKKCFPTKIIKYIAEKVYEGTQTLKCRIANSQTKDPIHVLFNQVWENFWHDPENYGEWEEATIEDLRSRLLV